MGTFLLVEGTTPLNILETSPRQSESSILHTLSVPDLLEKNKTGDGTTMMLSFWPLCSKHEVNHIVSSVLQSESPQHCPLDRDLRWQKQDVPCDGAVSHWSHLPMILLLYQSTFEIYNRSALVWSVTGATRNILIWFSQSWTKFLLEWSMSPQYIYAIYDLARITCFESRDHSIHPLPPHTSHTITYTYIPSFPFTYTHHHECTHTHTLHHPATHTHDHKSTLPHTPPSHAHTSHAHTHSQSDWRRAVWQDHCKGELHRARCQ